MNKLPFTDCIHIVGTAVKKFDGTKKYISTGALECDHIDGSQVEEVSYDSRPSRANLTAHAGDILFAKMQGTRKTLALDKETENHIYSTGFCAVRPKTDVITSRCLYHLISSADFLFQKDRNCSGATQKAITNSGLQKIVISIPDIAKQPKIAERLDLIDHATTICHYILESLDQVVKSRFIEMFGDPIANPKEWDLFPLLELGDCKNGMNFHKGEAGTEIKYLGVGDFQDKAIINIAEELDSISLNEMPKSEYLLRDGDIVFVRSNGSKELVGRCLVIYPGDIPTTYSGFCIRWRKKTDLIMPVYLVYTLKCESVRQKTVGRGANIQNLNQQILGQLNIPVPPLWLQQNFATFVQEIDKSKYEHENSKLFSLFITIFMISYIILRDISEYIFWNETKYFIWRVFQCQRYLCFLELLCECKVKKVENITNRIFTLYMGMMKL